MLSSLTLKFCLKKSVCLLPDRVTQPRGRVKPFDDSALLPATSQKDGYSGGPFVLILFGAGFDVELSGSAGVLAYFFFTYYLFRTTLCLLVQLVGLPLFLIGFGPFLCHANSFPRYFR